MKAEPVPGVWGGSIKIGKSPVKEPIAVQLQGIATKDLKRSSAAPEAHSGRMLQLRP